MAKRLSIVLALSLMALLSSCMKGEFSVLDSNLEKHIVVRDEEIEKSMRIRFTPSDLEQSYTFILTSPDGDLRWEGSFTREGDALVSDDLLTPSYIDFFSGEYSLAIHSSKGNDAVASASIPDGRALIYSLQEAQETEGLEILYLDEDGSPMAKEEASRASFSYTDRYGTDVSVFLSI